MTTTSQYRRNHGLCPRCGRIRNRKDRTLAICAICRARLNPSSPLQLGERLRVWRENRGYTKVDVGMRLGITSDQVSGLEHGTWPAKPTRLLQRRLARLLDCSLEALGFAPDLDRRHRAAPTKPRKLRSPSPP